MREWWRKRWFSRMRRCAAAYRAMATILSDTLRSRVQNMVALLLRDHRAQATAGAGCERWRSMQIHEVRRWDERCLRQQFAKIQ